MPPLFRGLWAVLALIVCGAAVALAGNAPFPAASPAATLPPPATAVPAAFAQPAPADAPIELPGPPPLPPLPAPEHEASTASPIGAETACAPWGGFFADAEYLYLKPYRRNLDFAIVSPTANADPEGPIASNGWHSRSAFRVGAGYRLPNDGWETGFFYTYLHDEQTGNLVQPTGGILFATQTHPGTVERVGRASAEATLDYDVFDLEVGRRMDAGENVTVRPFVGLRFAEITQNVSVLYDGGDANRDLVGSRIKFDGGGVRAGGEAELKLLDHVGVYGRAAGALLTGDFRVQQTEFNNGGVTPLTNVTESFRKVVPVMELGVGVAYHADHLRLSLGYEITDWINLIDTPSFVSDVHQAKYQRNVSDLGVDGFVLKAEIVY